MWNCVYFSSGSSRKFTIFILMSQEEILIDLGKRQEVGFSRLINFKGLQYLLKTTSLKEFK